MVLIHYLFFNFMKVLVVEDEKEILNFLKTNLKKNGFIVDTATDGESGSFLARTKDYDIILLDNNMPKKNGQEVCEEIRKDGKTMPIIMVSVKSEVTTKIDLLNSGADDYVTKPFSFEELHARMKALLRRPTKIENEILEVDDLILDTSKQKASRGNKDIYLTKKELLLLKYLMKNVGIVLSRNMIFDHVWDMNADAFSNTIESHIRSLRKKIDLKGKRKLLHTISGRGYKIDLKK